MSVSTERARMSLLSPPAVACTGKVGLASPSLAMQIINRNTAKDSPSRTPYLCGYCNLWHIGTDKGKVVKRKAHEFKERKQHDQ